MAAKLKICESWKFIKTEDGRIIRPQEGYQKIKQKTTHAGPHHQPSIMLLRTLVQRTVVVASRRPLALSARVRVVPVRLYATPTPAGM